MFTVEKVIYTAKAHTTGGREGGHSRTSDGRLEVDFSTPGGPGSGTNPEQLFATGWSACFLSALKLAAHKAKVPLPTDVAIDAEIDLGASNAAFGLAGRLNVSMPGVEREVAERLLKTAHQLCPYSRATDGNISATITLVDSAWASRSSAA